MIITLFIIGMIAFVAFMIYCCARQNQAHDFNDLFEADEVENPVTHTPPSDSSKQY